MKKVSIVILAMTMFFSTFTISYAEHGTRDDQKMSSSRPDKSNNHRRKASKYVEPVKLVPGQEITVKITGYCSYKKRKTKSEKKPEKGMIAADEKIFPIGSVLHSEELGSLTVEDTGPKVKGLHIDIYTGDSKDHQAQKKAYAITKEDAKITIVYLAKKQD